VSFTTYLDAIAGLAISVDDSLGYTTVPAFVQNGLFSPTQESYTAPPSGPFISGNILPDMSEPLTISLALSYTPDANNMDMGFWGTNDSTNTTYNGIVNYGFPFTTTTRNPSFEAYANGDFYRLDCGIHNNEGHFYAMSANVVYLLTTVWDPATLTMSLFIRGVGDSETTFNTVTLTATYSGSWGDLSQINVFNNDYNFPTEELTQNEVWVDSIDIAGRAWTIADHDFKWGACSGIGTGTPFSDYAGLGLLTDLIYHWDFDTPPNALVMTWAAPWWPGGFSPPPMRVFQPFALFTTTALNPVDVTAEYARHFGQPPSGSKLYILARSLSPSLQPNYFSNILVFDVP